MDVHPAFFTPFLLGSCRQSWCDSDGHAEFIRVWTIIMHSDLLHQYVLYLFSFISCLMNHLESLGMAIGMHFSWYVSAVLHLSSFIFPPSPSPSPSLFSFLHFILPYRLTYIRRNFFLMLLGFPISGVMFLDDPQQQQQSQTQQLLQLQQQQQQQQQHSKYLPPGGEFGPEGGVVFLLCNCLAICIMLFKK